jgi:ADP-ribose diphosphatase
MPTKPQVLKRSRVASSKIFHVESLSMRFANGVEREYERLLSNHHAVIIVPMLDDNRVILAQEYAAGTDDYQWALPKGKVDPGEDYVTAANRELQEEIGYAAEELILLKNMSQSPNYMQHSTQLVLARKLYPQTAIGDEPEPLHTQIILLSELEAVCEWPDFNEARSIAALYLARSYLHSQK